MSTEEIERLHLEAEQAATRAAMYAGFAMGAAIVSLVLLVFGR